MNKEFNITVHAIEQFIRRWEQSKNSEQAEEELSALLRTSKSVGKTIAGQTIMVSGHRPEIRMVIKDRNVCVTVLPPDVRIDTDLFYQEEMQKAYSLYQENNKKYWQNHKEELDKKYTNLQQQIVEALEQVKSLDEERKMLGQQKSDLMIEIQDL